MRKGFVVRDRSLSSLPSKQLSINQFMTQKSALQTLRSKAFEQSKMLNEKDEDIQKLKVNLDHALKLAVKEAIQTSKIKEESIRSTQSRLLVEKKYLQAAEQLSDEKISRMKIQGVVAGLQYELGCEKEEKRRIKEIQQQTVKEFEKVKKQLTKITELEEKITEIDPLKARIKILETNLRQEKLIKEESKKDNKKLEASIEQLKQKLKQTKPYQEELQRRIALLERVNLELQRKMEDFHRREHEYKKEVLHYKTALSKMTMQRNKFKLDFQENDKTLEQKLIIIMDLQFKIADQSSQIADLTSKLAQKTDESSHYAAKLQETIKYYKGVAQENQIMKKKVHFLQINQEDMRRVLAAHAKVSDQTNLYIISRNADVAKLEDHKKQLIESLEVLEKRFAKLDRLFDENSARGENQIKESYVATLKERNKFALEVKETKEELASKILQFGDERDSMNRKLNARSTPIPSEENLYESIISDKVEMILLLESSNDQLIKIKKQQQERIRELQSELQLSKKQIYNLRLKAAQLFKIKRDLEQWRSKSQRYQQMIEQSKIQLLDINSQLEVLRTKNTELGEKNYTMTMENKNLSFKVEQFQKIMKQLDVGYLQAKKTQNEKNAHLIIDSLEKMQNGINSLAYYFSCSFCSQLLTNPITIAPCGHNYCTKCKDAYSEYCYECDTGQQIQKVYSSKYLKESTGKYRFLVLVLKQTQANMMTINF